MTPGRSWAWYFGRCVGVLLIALVVAGVAFVVILLGKAALS